MADPIKAKTTRHRGTEFFGSKARGGLVDGYSYTDVPSKLLYWDLFYALYYAWALPLVVRPLRPEGGNRFDELAWGWGNAHTVLVHAALAAMQLGLLACAPAALFAPPWATAASAAAFWAVTLLLCRTLNGSRATHVSDPKYTLGREAHAHEKWLYINGIATGEHWLKLNLDRLALTFGRPVLGIHNPTYGIVFDLLECIVQRTFGYATDDIRRCYVEVKRALCDEQTTRVVFILHSQGGIEGGAIVDWLLQELPQNLLSKLEVYTFGNAANHFNNPFRSAAAEAEADSRPLAAAVDAALGPTAAAAAKAEAAAAAAAPPSASKPRAGGLEPPQEPKDERPTTTTTTPPGSPPGALAGREAGSRDPAALSGSAIGHIEHYCHSTDFVALWGALHFKAASAGAAGPRGPVFAGRVFSRAAAARGQEGHLLCQHYLNAMFPLERAGAAGDLVGCAETNAFMEGEVVVVGARGGGGGTGDDGGGGGGGAETMTRKVKELSRLWQYRNGRSPGVAA